MATCWKTAGTPGWCFARTVHIDSSTHEWDYKVVSERLGHASTAITLDVYSHVDMHMQEDAAVKVDSALLAALGMGATRK